MAANKPTLVRAFSLDAYLAGARPLVDAALERALDESGAPEPLLSAMKYAVLGEGKRLRPILAMAAAEAVGTGAAKGAKPAETGIESRDAAIALGISVELIHAYSLVHDDLPAMDDDDLRRGKPTVHKKFDEATAILVGDALQTLAFTQVANAPLSGRRRALAVAALATGAGARGMCGGQVLDLAAEGRWGSTKIEPEDVASRKTGALIAAAAELGAIAGGAGPKTRARLAKYGSAVGLAFQIADDLLDAEGSAEEVGKKTGKDAERGKTTFPMKYGNDGARRLAEELVAGAVKTVSRFENEGGHALEAIAMWAVRRRK